MKSEIKPLWVAALLSDEYKQGKRVLHNKSQNTYCCLGVLCDLAVKAGVEIEVDSSSLVVDPNAIGGDIDNRLEDVAVYDGSYTTLPYSVQQWAGVTEVGDIRAPDSDYPTTALTILNDQGKSFVEIAALIEEAL